MSLTLLYNNLNGNSARYSAMVNSEISRRNFLQSAASMAAGTLCANAMSAAMPPPNIVFILTDDLGYADLGCYGQKQIQTPNLDRMAAEGIRFTQCYAGATVCAPSRCCLLTGFHGGHARVRDNLPNDIWLRPDDFTIGELLKQAGYRTGAIGKWSMGDPGSWGLPNYQGFDYFYGHLSQIQAHQYYPDHLWENEKHVLLRGNRGGTSEQYTQDLFTEKAMDFIRGNVERPFFLYLAYTTPHWSDFPKDSPESQQVPSDAPYSDREWPQVEKNYAAMVTRLDADCGKISALLKELAIDSNTIVFFSSDNGPSAERIHSVDFFDSNGPLRGSKRDLNEGGIRVPMIVRCPGLVPGGRVSDQPWAFWDILPTFAALSGLPEPDNTDGISMLPTLTGNEQYELHDYFYWDYGHVRGSFTQAVRTGNWKGIRQGMEGSIALYNLKDDPGESTDVAATHSDIVQEIAEYMNDAFVASVDYPIAPLSKEPGDI